jgi:hypothetical protein
MLEQAQQQQNNFTNHTQLIITRSSSSSSSSSSTSSTFTSQSALNSIGENSVSVVSTRSSSNCTADYQNQQEQAQKKNFDQSRYFMSNERTNYSAKKLRTKKFLDTNCCYSRHSELILNSINNFKTNKTLCDVTLVAQGKFFILS